MSEDKLGRHIRNTKILKSYWHEHVTPIKNSVFGFLADAAIMATDPGSRVASEIYESAKGQMTVTSQQRALHLCHGTSERPTGRFPSERSSPDDSLVTGTSAAEKLRAIKSFKAWCLIILPLSYFHADEAVYSSDVASWTAVTYMTGEDVQS